MTLLCILKTLSIKMMKPDASNETAEVEEKLQCADEPLCLPARARSHLCF
jgi:hypothetical protein